MTVDSTTSTSIHISWTGSCPEMDTYKISWERDTTRKCPDIETVKRTTMNDSASFNITGLEEDSHYTITVTANKPGIAINKSVMGITTEASKGHAVSYKRSYF